MATKTDALAARLAGVIDWVRGTTDVAGGRGVLVPVSGGSDSALLFHICARALPKGRAVAAYVGRPETLRCREWFDAIDKVHFLPEPPGLASAAEPEVLRWGAMLSYSMKVRGWLAGSRTRTEEVFGTYSLASRLATYLPLAGLWKSEVMALCDAAGVPKEIIASSRRADPKCGRPRKMAAIPFERVDRFLQVKVGERPADDLAGVDPEQLAYLESVYRRNQFKRYLPMRPPA